MIPAILDHPWPLHENLDPLSDGRDALPTFENLVKRHDLVRVPFLDEADLHTLSARLAPLKASPTAVAALFRIAKHYCRTETGICTATPITGPSDLLFSWKRALRDGFGDVDDWRFPQIVLHRPRVAQWPNEQEVPVLLDACDGPPSGPFLRVVVASDTYEHHQFASADSDPWRTMMWRNRPAPGATSQFACLLPRPDLARGPLNELCRQLDASRENGWLEAGRYVFIPRSDWDPAAVTQKNWREGRAFPYKRLEGSTLAGPEDSEGRIWVWDSFERHWDVQFDGSYWSISEKGIWLK